MPADVRRIIGDVELAAAGETPETNQWFTHDTTSRCDCGPGPESRQLAEGDIAAIVTGRLGACYLPAAYCVELLRQNKNAGVWHIPGETQDLYARLANVVTADPWLRGR